MTTIPARLLLALFASSASLASSALAQITLVHQGTYATGIFNDGACEISAFDPESGFLFTINGGQDSLLILDITDPANPSLVSSVDLSAFGNPNSVSARDGLLAVCIGAPVRTDPGSVVFLDASGSILNSLTVGALPDMITFTPDGRYVLTANEGEPSDDYTVDPEGSISIIDLAKGVENLTQSDVRTAGFTDFNNVQLDPSVRIFGPNATVAQDLEPEYIAVDAASRYAYVTLQEANAIARVDIRTARVQAVRGLGFKDHSLKGNALDASDRDSSINIANWPVFGLYQPDAIKSVSARGRTYLVTANEGDARAYPGFNEEKRVKDLVLDPVAFPDAATLRTDAQLGRLTVTNTLGDIDRDNDFDALYAFGARSFSIYDTRVGMIFDSGDELEQFTAAFDPAHFNSTNDSNTSFDTRSDNKGPEPEGLDLGVVDNRLYLFLGLERIGGVVIYDITSPTAPLFIDWVNNRNWAGDPQAGAAGDLGPEGILFVKAGDSPTGEPLLITSNEISGTLSIFAVRPD